MRSLTASRITVILFTREGFRRWRILFAGCTNKRNTPSSLRFSPDGVVKNLLDILVMLVALEYVIDIRIYIYALLEPAISYNGIIVVDRVRLALKVNRNIIVPFTGVEAVLFSESYCVKDMTVSGII